MDDAASPEPVPQPPPPWWDAMARVDRRIWALVVLLALAGLTAVAVRGCGDPDDVEETEKDPEAKKKKDKEKKAPVPPFAIGSMRPLPYPSDANLPGGGPGLWHVKLGHWISYVQEHTSNLGDFTGELESTIVDAAGRPTDLRRTSYHLGLARPVALPKEQKVFVEGTLLVPDRADAVAAGAAGFAQDGTLRDEMAVDHRLRGRIGGGEAARKMETFRYMPDNQCHFIVLTRQPSDWVFMSRLPVFTPPPPKEDSGIIDGSSRNAPFRLVVHRTRAGAKNLPPLPSNPLAWTTIAHLVWDGFDPDDMSSEQQKALITWLHWGGRLIVNGPTSLDGLRNKFIEPYLPATGSDVVKLDGEFAEFNKKYQPEKSTSRLLPASDGVKLVLREGGEFAADSSQLIARRRVGRGHVVVTSFRLALPQLRLIAAKEMSASLLNTYSDLICQEVLERNWSLEQLSQNDFSPEDVTSVRWLSRDATATKTVAELATETEQEKTQSDRQPSRQPSPQEFIAKLRRGNPQMPVKILTGGPGHWSDFSAVSDAARESLRLSAGITVPPAEFVLWIVGLYLVALVPVNWLVFRLIGRVEWAWIAAPIMSIACTFLVVQLAQLDIGFARSRTEISIVELQPGHTQAHVTRSSALYTSFSTGYEARFDDPNALVLPFSKGRKFQRVFGEATTPVWLRNDGASVTLSGFQVTSNSTDLLHSEQLRDVGGALTWKPAATNSGGDTDDRSLVRNETGWDLSQVVVLRRVRGGFEQAEVGTLAAKDQARLRFRPWTPPAPVASTSDADEGDGSVSSASSSGRRRTPRPTEQQQSRTSTDPLLLGMLLEVVGNPHDLADGETRLIGVTTAPVEGLEITPQPSQQRFATVVVAHLHYND